MDICVKKNFRINHLKGFKKLKKNNSKKNPYCSFVFLIRKKSVCIKVRNYVTNNYQSIRTQNKKKKNKLTTIELINKIKINKL